MFWIKVAFVILLCLPILYLGFVFLNRLLDHAIANKRGDDGDKHLEPDKASAKKKTVNPRNRGGRRVEPRPGPAPWKDEDPDTRGRRGDR